MEDAPIVVSTLADGFAGVAGLLRRFGLVLERVATREVIPGSYWGEPEAGIVARTVYARDDTPLHSVLHEAAHIACMGGARRAVLERDAGGDDVEEAAVCYLQLVMADAVPGLGRERIAADMDAWGYSFRLGSTLAWFERDAEDARAWLEREGLLDAGGSLTFALRG